jgi:putative flippase GtrA
VKKLYFRFKKLIDYFWVAASGVLVQYLVGSVICIRWLQMPFQRGVLIGFLVSVPYGFLMSKRFAFDASGSGKTRKEFFRFLLVVLVSMLLTVKGSFYTLQFLSHFLGEVKTRIPFTEYEFNPAGTLSHFAGMGFSFLFNFLAHSKFTFSNKRA